MYVDIRVRGEAPAGIVRSAIEASIRAHLDRFGADVQAVHVRVTDVNGPRRGVDMHAIVSVQGPRIGALTVEDLHEAPTLAVTGALERIERAVQRDLERCRTMRHRPTPLRLRPLAAH